MLKLVTPASLKSTLDDIAREGARRMLITALQHEAADYVEAHQHLRDENGHRLVVKNGYGKERAVTVGSGTFGMEAPRVHDRRDGHKFTSHILPPYLRKSANVETLIPILYLRGLSTSDFPEALECILGEGVRGLSPASIVEMKRVWEDEFEAWNRRSLTEEYAYIWADGVNVKVRLGDDKKVCLLVIVGARIDGKKELLAVESGWRESKESWKLVLDGLVRRGMKPPLVAIGDGALGFWGAIRECAGFESTREQRCWVHKIANILDCFPKRVQLQAKAMLHEIMYSETKAEAITAKRIFDESFHAKYPKAIEKLSKDWEELTAFFSFPAEHWKHLRTTNPIESTFATVRLRTKITKGAGSVATAKTMTFKLLLQAEKKWRILNGHELLRDLRNGVEYRDGVVVTTPHQEAIAAG